MSSNSISKLAVFSRVGIYKPGKNSVCLFHIKYSQNVKPISMAYTAYETISPENTNDIPVLIFHGILGSKSNWNSMGRKISMKTFRKVVTVDLRNHGDSPHTKDFSYEHVIADIKHIMIEMDIKEASFLGHSLGGRAAMAFALTYPDMVHNLTVVDISPVSMSKNILQFPKILLAMKNIKLTSSFLTLAKARDECDRQLARSIQNKDARDFLLMNLAYDEGSKKFYWKVNIESLIRKVHNFVEFPFKGEFNKPTLFIGGKKSDYLKKEDEPFIFKKFPKSKFEYVEDAGHLIHIEKPDEFLDIVTTFLDGHNEILPASKT